MLVKLFKRYWYIIPFFLLALVATQRKSWKAGAMTFGWFGLIIMPKEVKEIKHVQTLKAVEQRGIKPFKYKYP